MMYNILTSNFDSDDSRLIRSLYILNLFLGISAVVFFIFFLLANLLHFNFIIMLFDLLGFIISLALFFDLRLNKNINRVKYIMLFVIFSFFITFFFLNKAEDFGMIWVLIFPIASIVLLGVKRGVLLVSIYFAIVFTLAFNGIGVWDYGTWTMTAFLRLVAASSIIVLGISTTEIALENSYKNLERLSSLDSLTGLYNRRKINQILKLELNKSDRYKTVVSLILFDIDDFKKVNDNFGHNNGDKVLKKLSNTLSSELRNGDSMARWGGEEFLIVLPMLNIEEAKNVAEKLRIKIEEMTCDIDSLTCSFGVAQYEEKDSTESFINRVDKAMYRAKEQGKNRVSS